MNFKGRGEDVESVAYLIIPFLSLLFILMLFCTAVTAMFRDEKLLGIEVINLPVVSEAVNDVRVKDELIININDKGKVFLNGTPLSTEVLETKLSQLALFSNAANCDVAVIIRADGQAQHRTVIDVMNICSRAGAKYISFGTYASSGM